MSVPPKKTYKPSKKKGAISFTDKAIPGVFIHKGPIAGMAGTVGGGATFAISDKFIKVSFSSGGEGYIPIMKTIGG